MDCILPGSSVHGIFQARTLGNGYSLQCSCLENSKDRGAWQGPSDLKELDTTEQLPLCTPLKPITMIYAINISITSKSFLSFCLFSCFVTRTLNKRSTLIVQFWVYNGVLLTIGFLLYIRSRIHSFCVTDMLCPSTNISLLLPTLCQVPGNYHFTPCFYLAS